jgi:hypothetical protein
MQLVWRRLDKIGCSASNSSAEQPVQPDDPALHGRRRHRDGRSDAFGAAICSMLRRRRHHCIIIGRLQPDIPPPKDLYIDTFCELPRARAWVDPHQPASQSRRQIWVRGVFGE